MAYFDDETTRKVYTLIGANAQLRTCLYHYLRSYPIFFGILFFLAKKRLSTNKTLNPAIAAMHGTHSVFDNGQCAVIHCDA